MNSDSSSAPFLSAVRRGLVLAGGTVLLATSCGTTPEYGPDGNVFVQPRYGYGSPNQASPSGNRGQMAPSPDRTADRPSNNRRTPDIKRDPNDTSVDITPPESRERNDSPTDPAIPGDPSTPTENIGKEKPADPIESKPAAPREDLPFGQPVVGKKGYVYSPYAPDKGQVDVEDIPAGTKVKCPYTGKVFRVP